MDEKLSVQIYPMNWVILNTGVQDYPINGVTLNTSKLMTQNLPFTCIYSYKL